MITTPPSLPQTSPGRTPPPIRQRRSTLTILTAIVSVAAVCFVGFIGFRVLSLASYMMKNRPAVREHVVEAPSYETLLGEGMAGSGFHFQGGNSVYLCASLHQFDGKTPAEMSSFDFDSVIKVVNVIHKQNDIQVLSFLSEDLKKIAPLPYSEDAPVNVGLPIYVYAETGAVKGHVSSIDRATGTIKIRMKEAFRAGGQSGGPIVSGETGTVIAVLIGANSAESATRVDAELLRFSDPLPLSKDQ